ncbi:serine/threonine protein kinase BUD32 [Cyberlindnera jadinii NRRL Y-1542]|uniref:EKC/KEOPS complex subunit BUD32 n=1 Tax=Cyberlindnera jadinii (strain ATCC 18201 / CBS 1600 / BCRC 20928 / JCM 3617 / NBRC 0987 / NRRL Y-1542) TaxID=983966 RepID=A0A1E4S664_CYBJN|nr:kinase-like protein [Cyberlindnera jadinii NRRL Y-1542]ODV74978.1 kinase-like protein [Cyberlindnera jadinii NRRL Y-1542]
MSDHLVELAKSHLTNIPVSLISQGAESLIFTTTTHPYMETSDEGQQYIVKFRPPKKYRHPQLDAQLTKRRTLAEARLLQRLYGADGISVPSIIAVDARNGILWLEYIGQQIENGVSSLKNYLWLEDSKADYESLLRAVGDMIARLHQMGIVHGDLTTSNVMLQKHGSQWAPCLIDFGLGFTSDLVEDKAVDLYVLERAILSTHPVHSDNYNSWLMEGYKKGYGKDQGKFKQVMKRYEDVRMRGRKRSMLG